MDNNIPRRDFLFKIVAPLIVVPSVVSLTGCPGVAVFARVTPSLSRVFWGAVRTRAAVTAGRHVAKQGFSAFRPRASSLVVKGLVDASQEYFVPRVSSSDMERLKEEHPPLTVVDRNGKGTKFENTPYGIYEEVGIIQSCYGDEPLVLFEDPDFDSSSIRSLDVGEEVGVFSLEYTSDGWYHVQTTSEEVGWIHGNCLEELPPPKYY